MLYGHLVHNKFDFLEFLNKKSHFYVIYIDGSKSTNSVRAAYYDLQKNSLKNIKLEENCSIFTTESYAIVSALVFVNNFVHNVNILIVSDSKSVLESLYNCNYSYIGVKTEFVWVPSHSGIPGNEVVEQVARRDHVEDQSEMLNVLFTDYYRLIKNLILLVAISVNTVLKTMQT
ncbi:uncharacterized protein LOC128201259 [Galleria mellonella]|uniref:Uncharacterized protein LOC128201259 n=1 Tax=Galleria mellonella TaxID=7137 RepID=A0ABM3MQL9_GALME|nr:uncharacterized protein LOC128201259 [Galleria mellonella]